MMRHGYIGKSLKDEMLAQGKIWCSHCENFYPADDFNKNNNKRSNNYGYRSWCRQCDKDYTHRTKDRITQRFKKRNVALKIQFVELAGGKCQRCGYDTFYAALEFHHVYAIEKEHNPASVISSANFAEAWRELDKCCLLCSNCHNGYGAGLWRAEFIKRDGLLGWTVGNELPLNDKRYQVKNPPQYYRTPDLSIVAKQGSLL